MNFPYFGATIQNVTLTQAAGTRREIVDFIATTLAAAGWTYVSGSGTGTPILRSALTPHGLRCRVKLSETDDATNATLYPQTDDSYQAGAHFLRPGVGNVWRCIASPYYVRVFFDSPTVSYRDFANVENLWIPQPFRGAVTEACFSTGNCFSGSATNTSTNPSFRDRLHNYAPLCANLHAYNGNRWQGSNGNQPGYISISISLPGSQGQSSASSAAGRTWADGSWNIEDAPVAWGLTAATDTAAQRGTLGDALIIGGIIPYGMGNVITIDGHTWMPTAASSFGFTLCYLVA